jgi:hypothetical protein
LRRAAELAALNTSVALAGVCAVSVAYDGAQKSFSAVKAAVAQAIHNDVRIPRVDRVQMESSK